MNDHVFHVITNIGIFEAAFFATLFVAAYSRQPWFRSRIGRALMVKGVAVAILFDLSAAAVVWGPFLAGHPWIGMLLVLALATGITYQCYALLRSQWDQWREGYDTDTAYIAHREGKPSP